MIILNYLIKIKMDYKDYFLGKSKLNFWFRGRTDLFYRLLKSQNKKNLKILNIGGGTGDNLEILNNFGEVYIIDIDKRAIDLIPEKLCKEKKVCNACDLSYQSNFFDIVTSFDVFEHINEQDIAIKEIKRVLKPGGGLIFSVPAFQLLYGSHDKALGHKRRYSKKNLKKLLQSFNNLKLNYWNCILFIPMATLRLMKKNAPAKIDNPKPPKIINELLFRILNIENLLIEKSFRFPFGLTIIGYCEK